ncbi:MAG: DUF6893 family small protein [Carbonactinosporaceae bacterium]
MKKMARRLIMVGALMGLGFLVAQSMPDARRYLKIRQM